MKKHIIVPAILLSIAGALFAQDDDKSPKIEQGFRFGDISKSKDDLKKVTEKQLLLELVKLNKKQLKEQKRIREILENKFEPKPKMMTLPDGTKCIENSSAKCFKMPMIDSIKKIPVYVNAYQKRTLKAEKAKDLWEAKYISEVQKLAYLKGQAIRELGPKYPLATTRIGTINNFGLDSVAQSRYEKSIVNKYMHNFEINIFLGINKGLDMYSLVRLAYIVRDNPKWKINLIFKSTKAKNDWEKQYKNFYVSRNLLKLNTIVQPSAFKEFKIYTTPSLFLKDKKLHKDTLIFIGRATEEDIVSRILDYLINKKYIKRNELSRINAWKSPTSEGVVKDYYNDALGIDYEK